MKVAKLGELRQIGVLQLYSSFKTEDGFHSEWANRDLELKYDDWMIVLEHINPELVYTSTWKVLTKHGVRFIMKTLWEREE